jgi:hypothetical protein
MKVGASAVNSPSRAGGEPGHAGGDELARSGWLAARLTACATGEHQPGKNYRNTRQYRDFALSRRDVRHGQRWNAVFEADPRGHPFPGMVC